MHNLNVVTNSSESIESLMEQMVNIPQTPEKRNIKSQLSKNEKLKAFKIK